MELSKNSSLSIDCIRFVAAEMVVVGHGFWDFELFEKSPVPFPMHDLAVLIFFILSGFLISFSVAVKMRSKEYTFKEYFIDRFSRIYFALIPCLLFVAVLDLLFIYYFNRDYEYSDTLNSKTFFGNLLMLEDHPVLLHLKYFFMASSDSILYIGSFGSGRPLWSLAVEWWLYMGFGWLLLKSTASKKGIYYGGMCLFLIVPVYNLFSGAKSEGLTLVWIMGCLITIMLDYNKEIKNVSNGFLSFLFAFLAFLTAVNFQSGYNILTAALFTLSLYFLVLVMNKSTTQVQVLLEKTIKFGAGYSFTLYLLHYTVLEYALVFPENYSPITRFWLYFIISNLVSLLLAIFTEMRHKQFSNYLKKKFLYG